MPYSMHTARAASTCLSLLVAASALPAQATIAPRKDYAAVAATLERLADRELNVHDIPGLSIALVDDTAIVWARGLGLASIRSRGPATAQTVYRVGSITKTFTDAAVLRMAELGLLDLDTPVTRYIADFAPKNPFGDPITLRQLMAHRSGLPRRPPAGNYYDASSPSLEKTVASLNRTELLFAPGDKTKYSNAGLAVAGLVIERVAHEPYAAAMTRLVFAPLGMTSTSMRLTPEMQAHMATGYMWGYEASMSSAPTFALGIAPAGDLYSTAPDLARWLSVVVNGGRTPAGTSFLKAQSVFEMTRPQFVPPATPSGWGLGFYVWPFEGRKRLANNGSGWGFAGEMQALPEEKIGVVVLVNKDYASAVGFRLADAALRLMLAAKHGQPLPKIAVPRTIPAAMAKSLTSHYANASRSITITRAGGAASMLDDAGGTRARLMWAGGDTLITDDELGPPKRIVIGKNMLVMGRDTLLAAPNHPEVAAANLAPLKGDYGWPHYTLHVIEQRGRLVALTDGFVYQPLTPVSENVYKFPDLGWYDGETLTFVRNADGSVSGIVSGGVAMPRRRR
ncbi:MAG: beta-lactamase family protein [Gemmatimonadota bacterium]|nr:beta-lactamase family protein [Gemmatimonadota bacterium]